MLSRIADSLFWLNRYTERSDSLLRLVYVHHILSLDRSLNAQHHWRSVLQVYSASPQETIEAIEDDTAAVLHNLLVDESNSNSVKAIVRRARENARGAQDHITKEVWEVVNQLYHQVHQPSLAVRLRTEQGIKAVDGFSKHMALYAGITDNTMSRGLGWNFMNLGKYVERCQQTLVLTRKELEYLDSTDVPEDDILQWRYLLLALSGYEMHLKTYPPSGHRNSVLHQVLLNENFTRSVLYSLVRVRHYLENIMHIHEDQKKELLHAVGRLNSKVQYMDLKAFTIASLQTFLSEVSNELFALTNLVGQTYFSYS